MADDTQLQRFLKACATYQRDLALAQIDQAPGDARAARLADVVRSAAEVCSGAELQLLQNAIDETPAPARAALQRLKAWGLETHLRGAVLRCQQDIQAQQRTATCILDEQPIPLLASFSVMAAENRRDRRAAIEAAVGEKLADTNTLFEAFYQDLRHASAALGYASLEALWSEILPVEPAALQDDAVRVLEETHDVYIDLLTWAAKRRLDVPPGQLRRHDSLVLFTFPEYQRYYQPGTLVSSLPACLLDMGLDPHADGRIVERQCPPEFGPADAVAVQIPDEIVLMYSGVSGLKSAEVYAGAYGKALSWAYTSPALPRLTRLLGDAALPMSGAQLFAEMITLPGWLQHYHRVTVDASYWPWRRLDRLYRLRRQLGRFLYARYVGTADSLAGAQEAYREIMMNACQVDHHPAYYLVDWDWTYSSLSLFRGWKLTYAMFDTLWKQFSHDWFRNSDLGSWLRDYWQAALEKNPDVLSERLQGEPWEAARLSEFLIDEAVW